MSKKETQKEDRSANERAVFDKPVKAQRGDIHKVVSQGVTIEFTDRMNSAATAFKEANKPKQWFLLSKEGGVKCLGNEII